RGALNELTMIAEGYFAASGIKQICDERNLQLPVADMVYKVLYQNMNARKAMLNLASQF
ncbi:MAG: glycerol-3-phosphate dehydrogenase, partial [Bacteroidales bacterium]|nr:glycerol-3-phosphate dehydrogenase [Bacteroidales bacterium]